MKKIAFLISHPIQYYAPIFRELAKKEGISLKVFYCWDFGVKAAFDGQFRTNVKWDIPLLDGYDYEFLPNWSPYSSSSFWGQINPKILSRLLTERYDAIVVHGYAILTNWLAFFGAWISHTPLLLRGEANLLQRRSAGKSILKNIIIPPLFKSTSAFLAIGRLNADYYKHYGVPQEKIFLAPYVSNENFFVAEARKKNLYRHETRQKLGIEKNNPVILYAGKIFGEKGPGALDLLAAFERINERLASTLVFVGDGKEKVFLESRVKEKGTKNVFFVGFKNQTEISRYYAASDILVLPSYSEQWGIVVNEAMYFGNAIIASDKVGASYDLVREGKNGFVFPAGNVAALTKKLTVLLTDIELLQKMQKESEKIIESWGYKECVSGLSDALIYLERKKLNN